MSQLGMGPDEMEALRPKPVLHLQNIHLTSFSAGGGANAVIIINEENKKEVWTWGCNDLYCLGRPTKGESEQSTPNIVKGLEGIDVIQISVGDNHMVALDSTGSVYSWGCYRDSSGILGFKPGINKQLTPEIMTQLNGKKIIQIGSGENISFALTKSGTVYLWGDSRISQRTSSRNNLKQHILLPSPVPSSKKFQSIFCGGYHSLLLATDGSLWAFGLNNFFQLGIGSDDLASVPKSVKGLPDKLKIKMGSTGQHHSMILSEEGQVYTWGRGEYGQLGHNDRKNLSSPKLVDFFQNLPNDDHVIQISAGGHHSLAVTKLGDVYTWGFGTMSQLGLGPMNDEDDRLIPTKVNNEDKRSQLFGNKVIWASGGGQHSLFAIIPKK